MITNERIRRVLETIPDPEMPISIVDLGLLHAVRVLRPDAEHDASRGAPSPSHVRVEIDLIPTFVGCPALDMIREQVCAKVASETGCRDVRVNFVHEPPWSVDRISAAGREQLRSFGVTVPDRSSPGAAGALVPLTVSGAAPACPFCGAAQVELTSRFGPTRCKMIYYCNACRNSFEHLKLV